MPTVLVVDETEAALEVIERHLARVGFRVLSARDAEEALAFIDDAVILIDICLVDLSLPGMNGMELAAEIVRRRPDTPVLLMSADEGVPESPFTIMAKPFAITELIKRAWELMERRGGGGRDPSQADE